MVWRRRIAVTVFGAGVLVPVIARLLGGPAMALRALPLAVLMTLIGGVLWIRADPRT